MQHAWDTRETCKTFWYESLKEELGVDGRIILNN
jgi:hypothetical protein